MQTAEELPALGKSAVLMIAVFFPSPPHPKQPQSPELKNLVRL
jgi:hypothetical protein